MERRKQKPLADRFWKLVEIRGDDECWLWTGYKNKAGYGKIHGGEVHNWFPLYAHRVSWDLSHPNDTAKPGRNADVICHTCDNPACVNPNHLWKGTHKDNARDMIEKGRMRIGDRGGSKNGRAILKESDIPKILLSRKQGMQYKDIAKKFGVSISSISDILNGRHWRKAI